MMMPWKSCLVQHSRRTRECGATASPHHDTEGLMQGPVLIPGILSQVYRAGNADEYLRQMGLPPTAAPCPDGQGSS